MPTKRNRRAAKDAASPTPKTPIRNWTDSGARNQQGWLAGGKPLLSGYSIVHQKEWLTRPAQRFREATTISKGNSSSFQLLPGKYRGLGESRQADLT